MLGRRGLGKPVLRSRHPVIGAGGEHEEELVVDDAPHFFAARRVEQHEERPVGILHPRVEIEVFAGDRGDPCGGQALEAAHQQPLLVEHAAARPAARCRDHGLAGVHAGHALEAHDGGVGVVDGARRNRPLVAEIFGAREGNADLAAHHGHGEAGAYRAQGGQSGFNAPARRGDVGEQDAFGLLPVDRHHKDSGRADANEFQLPLRRHAVGVGRTVIIVLQIDDRGCRIGEGQGRRVEQHPLRHDVGMKRHQRVELLRPVDGPHLRLCVRVRETCRQCRLAPGLGGRRAIDHIEDPAVIGAEVDQPCGRRKQVAHMAQALAHRKTALRQRLDVLRTGKPRLEILDLAPLMQARPQLKAVERRLQTAGLACHQRHPVASVPQAASSGLEWAGRLRAGVARASAERAARIMPPR